MARKHPIKGSAKDVRELGEIAQLRRLGEWLRSKYPTERTKAAMALSKMPGAAQAERDKLCRELTEPEGSFDSRVTAIQGLLVLRTQLEIIIGWTELAIENASDRAAQDSLSKLLTKLCFATKEVDSYALAERICDQYGVQEMDVEPGMNSSHENLATPIEAVLTQSKNLNKNADSTEDLSVPKCDTADWICGKGSDDMQGGEQLKEESVSESQILLFAAFLDELPELLQSHRGEYVAFVLDDNGKPRRLGIEKDLLGISRRCRQQQISADRYRIEWIFPQNELDKMLAEMN